MKLISAIAVTAALALPAPAWAHGEAAQKPSAGKPALAVEEKAFGRPGDPKKVTRTIQVEMNDSMKFFPAELRIRRGETIRLVVKNSGQAAHEMVLGTLAELKEHAEIMKKNPGMEHDEPYMAHVAPGKTERIVWQFSKAGKFNYGCLVPGHFEAGMIGKLIVTQ